MGENLALAIATVLPGLLLGYLGYRLSKRKDLAAEKANAITGTTQQIAQAFDALQKLVTLLQDDKRIDADEIRNLTEQRDKLQRELIRMYRKYGNGNSEVI